MLWVGVVLVKLLKIKTLQMYRLTFILIFCGVFTLMHAKSPHGDKHTIDCATCHTTDNWNKIKENGFNHNKTKFPLTGQHKAIACKQCHSTLKFEDAKTECNSCHTDVHQGTTGHDCDRCHTTNSWIIPNTRTLHQQAGFPLKGAHATADCNRCHTSASKLRFDNIRTDCFACHKDKYYATAGKPFDHKVLGFDTDCARCHNMSGMDWNSIGKGFDHSYFPLTGGHNIDCNECHYEGDYRKRLSTDCFSCHSSKKAVATAVMPVHTTKFAKFSCNECHTAKSWNNVSFKQHDAWGKIYSGEHKGEWDKCTDCHNNDAAYVANCRKCHDFSSGRLP